jgi:hypothetical protein
MSLLQQVKSSRRNKPRKTVLVGIGGIGKSTFFSQWPDPVFIPTEDGLADLDVPTFPLCQDLATAWQAIMELGAGGHDFKTVVIDSADWLEQLIWQDVCRRGNKSSITDFDFGKGFGEASTIFRKILTGLDSIVESGSHVCLTVHARTTKVEPPGQPAYNRYEPKLHKSTSNGMSASEILQEWCDELLFTNYKIDVRTEEQGFNRKRGVAIEKGERVIYTQEGPAHLAKNRLRLPREMPLDYRAYRQYIEPDAVDADDPFVSREVATAE